MSINRLPLRSFTVLALAVSATFLISGATYAAQPTKPKDITYNGVTVSPAIIKVNIQPGQAKADFNVSLTNNTTDDVDLSVSSVDFKSLNSSGGLAFISSNSSEVFRKHGLANWLNLNIKEVHLSPNQTQLLPMSVENREDLSPGGHYAAILFKSIAPSSNKGLSHVAINQVVSSLVFVQKLGGEKFGLSMAKPESSFSALRLPDNIDLAFTNTGNTQETPSGLVTITDPLGREVARGQVNTDSSIVLPESTRIYRTSLFGIGRAWLPGIYRTKVTYHSEGPNTAGVQTSSFVYLNLKFLAVILLVVIVVINVARKSTTLLRWRRTSRNH